MLKWMDGWMDGRTVRPVVAIEVMDGTMMKTL